MKKRRSAATTTTNAKIKQLDAFADDPIKAFLTTDQGVPIEHTDDSLKAGARGPTLLEDFHLREKITRFDHERIPERVVHARGSGAHGVFQVYEPLNALTSADFLQNPEVETPVFVRFSTVVGSRGSADTVRDVRGFAVKFYTQKGNFDLVGNNMPVFFIQDGIKFPDLVHAVKPEPADEMPQAGSAHDSFWDFVSLVPETAHMVLWVMSDRGIPRSYRMMEGFGVHTFRLVNAEGVAHFVKFHWKPLLGAHSLVWDEAQKLAGTDPDFHRRDLWAAIDRGEFPEWELGLQVIPEADEQKYGFDLLDATKLIPEELVPVRRVGKLTLNRNPRNFFAETEQVAFDVGNIVPGIDFTNDPLMQARLFSYVDTQLTRLGGPNFAEIPINQPIVAVDNHQQDGFQRHTIQTGAANYHPNSIGGGCPFLAPPGTGFVHRMERVDGATVRARSDSFLDHFSQATLFLRSQSEPEHRHLVQACRFELAKVMRPAIRKRVLGIFHEIDPAFALEVAVGIGVSATPYHVPAGTAAPTHRGDNGGIHRSPALSLEHQPPSIRTRVVAVFATGGFVEAQLNALGSALLTGGARYEIVSTALGTLTGDDGGKVEVYKTLKTASSVFYDGLFVAGNASGIDELLVADGLDFVRDAFKHCKTLGAFGEGARLLDAAQLAGPLGHSKRPKDHVGVAIGGTNENPAEVSARFVELLAKHRHWGREAALS